MGIASMFLGDDNPFSKYVADNRQTLQGAFAGFGQGPTFAAGLGNAAMGAQRGSQMDDVTRQQREAEAKATEQTNVTRSWLEQQGFTDLVPLVDAGQADIAYGEALKRMQPGYGQAEAPKPTSAIQEYEYARQQGYGGSFQEYETAMKQAGATNIDMNNSQALAGGYADRMANANAILDDPKITQAQLDPVQAGAGAVPVVGNFLTSNERKMAEQAQRDFVNAILRRESGAAIAESEFQNAAKQYFPQPGDTPEVIEQKRRNREIAIQGVSRAAGSGYQPPALGGGQGWQVLGVE